MGKRDKKQRKQKKRQERLRQQRHQIHSQPKERDEDYYDDYVTDDESFDPDEPLDEEYDLPPEQLGAMGNFGMERHLRDIHKAIEGKDFENIDDLNAHLQSLMSSGELGMHRGELSNQDRAQDLAYQAMESDDPKEAVWRAKQAVELDPDCMDALIILGVHDSKDLDDCIGKLKKAVEAGERSLGSDFFEENKGHFWGITETRPYMRARETLAQHLVFAERYEEAKDHFEAMMELNPGDNQGLRFPLLACYLLLRDLESAYNLLKQSEDYMDATLLWGKVLCDYLSGDTKTAAMTLQQARKENPYAEIFFSGKKMAPSRPPAGYSPGEKSEAAMCAFILGSAWYKNPEAMRWLKSGGNEIELRVVK